MRHSAGVTGGIRRSFPLPSRGGDQISTMGSYAEMKRNDT